MLSLRPLIVPRLLLVASCIAATASGPDASVPPPREVALVARGMAFFLAGASTPNPTIRVSPGERIRIVLRNDTPGMVHDFAVASLGASISPLTTGRSAAVEITAPGRPGRYSYRCRPHSLMMQGAIEVVGN